MESFNRFSRVLSCACICCSPRQKKRGRIIFFINMLYSFIGATIYLYVDLHFFFYLIPDEGRDTDIEVLRFHFEFCLSQDPAVLYLQGGGGLYRFGDIVE